MKIVYDPEADVLRISLSSAAIAETAQTNPGMILDYDEDGHIIGLEIINASQRTDNPYSVEYTVITSSMAKLTPDSAPIPTSLQHEH